MRMERDKEIWAKLLDLTPGHSLSMRGNDTMTFFYWHDGMRRNIRGLCHQYSITVERRDRENDFLITKLVK